MLYSVVGDVLPTKFLKGTKTMTQKNFNYEQAEAIVSELAMALPEGVKLQVNDVGSGDGYKYSFIAFRLNGLCVCTVDTLDELVNLERFIELMAGFTYPPMEPEPLEIIPLHNDKGEYVDEHGRPLQYARDRSGNPTENEPSEKYTRPFDPGYIPVEPGVEYPF